MEKLIDTPGQTFYYSTIESLINNIGDMNKCAVILADEDLPIFFDKAAHLIGNSINQIIVIGHHVDHVYQKIQGLTNVFIIAAVHIKDATQIALNSSSLSKNVMYISSISSNHNISDLLSLIEE